MMKLAGRFTEALFRSGERVVLIDQAESRRQDELGEALVEMTNASDGGDGVSVTVETRRTRARVEQRRNAQGSGDEAENDDERASGVGQTITDC